MAQAISYGGESLMANELVDPGDVLSFSNSSMYKNFFVEFLTWRHISKSNGGHCHKTEIEGIKKGPVLKKKIMKNINHCQEVERVLISDADFFITYF